MPARLFAVALLAVLPLLVNAKPPTKADTLSLPLRSRVETFKGSAVWDEVSLRKEFGSRPLQHVAFASHIIACPQTVEDGEFLGRLGRIIKERPSS